MLLFSLCEVWKTMQGVRIRKRKFALLGVSSLSPYLHLGIPDTCIGNKRQQSKGICAFLLAPYLNISFWINTDNRHCTLY